MPSKALTEVALAAVAPRIARFRTAAAAVVEQSRAFLATCAVDEGERVGHVSGELGAFAAGRLDAARFAELFSAPTALPTSARSAIEQAISAVEVLLARGDQPFTVRVPHGDSLRDHVARAFGECGRVFGAALVIDYARQGVHAPDHVALLGTFPFHLWSRAERRLAPPLVVEVEGADLAAGSLAEFVDGTVALVLVVHGECSPAPLVRLVTPATFVLQTADPSELARLGTLDGPAVAALVDESAAHFVHEPSAAAFPWRRTTVSHLPSAVTRSRPRSSVAQQQEELAQLLALSTPPTEAGAAATAAPGARAALGETLSSDPTDRLSAWLVAQVEGGT